MRRWWTSRGERARWGIVIACLVGALVLWGAADQVVLERYQDDRQAHSITQEEFDLAPVGARQAVLLERFGEPEEPLEADEEGAACVTYKEQGAALLRERTYRLCFEGGALSYKDFAPIEDPELLTEGAALEEK